MADEMESNETNKMEEEESDSESNDDDDSESDADAEEDQEDIALLEARIKTTDGRDYDAFVHLLRIFRDRSHMPKLEKLREKFSASFPLAEGQHVLLHQTLHTPESNAFYIPAFSSLATFIAHLPFIEHLIYDKFRDLSF